ncbi:putative disease resistance protein At4g19050 [Herrania umbratica]|uniref:Disease resistance protein At4g19050 n=1 Tax=Herrania umbratica TaxID=108875 RepID=A0A6J1BB63_9ROSI|nr:putative disease resistance protein At4g19050 [Herrania umbratica]
MSNTGASTHEISEENEEDSTQETNGEHEMGSPQYLSEEHNDVMKLKATEDHAKKIFHLLENSSVSKIILTGEAGTGKTWMARIICKLAVKNNHDEPLWISLEQKHDENSLYDTIARQFSLPTSTDAREDTGENEKKEGSVKNLKEEKEEKLKAAQQKMEEKLTAAQGFILIVLDGQVGTMTENGQKEEMVSKILGLEVCGKNHKGKFKILITRRDNDGGWSEGTKKVAVEPLSGDEALKLLNKENVVDEVLQSPGFKELSEAIQKKSKVLPANILMLAGTLNYIAKDNAGNLNLALEAAANDLRQLLRYTYDKEPANCMIDCFWHSWHFLGKHGGVHYNELITNWIMERDLNPTDPIEKAYEEGHRVLMKLIDCHLLKMQEDNVVVLEGATLDMNEYCRRGYTEPADPGLASVLKDYDWKVLEGITPADGMMKTLCSDKKEEMISSLLIDGSRLSREVHETFFGAKPNLNLLAIFYPRLRSSEELSISKMEKLLGLLLRGSYLLEDIKHISKLQALTVLEISGSTYLKEIPDEFFNQVSRLRSLNLSALGIESLPSSFPELTELRRLILRQCSSLRELPKLVNFSKLEVIDLSESINLEKIQEKSFKSFEQLQVINFSCTKIEKLPIVKSLQNLKIILLRGCHQLVGMRSLKQVSRLKILDLSGAVKIREIMYDSFEGADDLRELDLSETKIQFLPSDICNLQKLRLKGCSSLIDLPELKGHRNLEELDLSGCKSLVKLPDLTALQNLKILVLNDCSKLESLPDLKSLSKLEKLDIRGTNLWSKDVEESLTHMTRLQILK